MNDYSFKTKRLNIRTIIESDLDKIHELNSMPETAEFNTGDIPNDIDESRYILTTWISNNNQELCKSYTFAVELTDTNAFIGLISINLGKEKYKNAEVWFKFHKNYWSRGYATETLKEIILFGFLKLKLHRIEGGCATGNTGSFKVMEKCGMKREAHTRLLLPLKSGWSDNYGYAILSSDLDILI